ncbi:MAG: FGGY-family carbohydrate kinase, partial [Pseudomonadota bacterium]
GLSTGNTQAELTQAVLEGVAFGLRDSLEALRGAGAELDHLIAIGGGTGSAYWLRLIATVLNLPLHLPAGGEFGAALGAARLGMAASSGADVDDLMRAPEIAEVTEPARALVPEYEAAYQRYRAAYPLILQAQ